MARHGITTPGQPIIMALENSGMCGSIALVSPGLCVAESSLTTAATHSKRLMGGIAAMLKDSGLDWPAIDAVAVSLGPGSFTGLRISLAAAKGIAMAADKKLIGIPTLDGLAAQIQTNILICPLIDARKNQVYTAFYRRQEGECRRLSPYAAITPDNLGSQIKEPVIFIGDGGVLYHDLLRDKLPGLANFANPTIFFPRAAAIGSLAIHRWQADEFLDPLNAVPLYIRASDAEKMKKPVE
ncbi:MAG TPA: tRNA (adenosine(37)-N6)-threonylcarbamoyltransferase complex dimerization subunit type 1 TsaB [Desulfobacterales bacterium]|nr:tRNA (adenosine(37)-N6)-threonylcarbamoyltransferase complex dimerization subunit type 1 TsaB [Desulfobacterales bacterium]